MNSQGDMDIRNEIGLEFVQIHIETAVEPQGGCNTGDNLGNESIKICERRRADVKVLFANIVNSFVVHLKKCHTTN
jgi:hypothetical protein